MSVKDIFSHNKKLSQRKFGRLYSKDARMKEVFDNKQISKALDKTSERNEFYDMLKSKKKGGVTKQKMKEALGEWMSGKGRTISRKEAYTVAKEFFGDERVKYIMPKGKAGSPAYAGDAGFLGGAEGANQNFPKSSGSSGNIQVSTSRSIPSIQKSAAYSKTSDNSQIIYKKVSSSAQNTQSSKKSAKRNTQPKARRRFIPAGLAAIVDMMGPAKSKENKARKGDFFRAVNAMRRNRGIINKEEFLELEAGSDKVLIRRDLIKVKVLEGGAGKETAEKIKMFVHQGGFSPEEEIGEVQPKDNKGLTVIYSDDGQKDSAEDLVAFLLTGKYQARSEKNTESGSAEKLTLIVGK